MLIKLKVKFYSKVVRPALMYGSERWKRGSKLVENRDENAEVDYGNIAA